MDSDPVVMTMASEYLTPDAVHLYLDLNITITTMLVEAASRLQLSLISITTACTLYHRFYKDLNDKSLSDIDRRMVSAAALYLAAKVEEEPKKIRDVINVCHRILHPNDAFLQIGKRYWSLRDSVLSCELLMLRVLQFQVSVDTPHKYLLHYLNSLSDWVNTEHWEETNIAQVSWNLLQDTVHLPLCISYKSEVIAVAIIYCAVQSTHLEINTEGSRRAWWQIFLPGCSEEKLQEIGMRLFELYEYEKLNSAKDEQSEQIPTNLTHLD